LKLSKFNGKIFLKILTTTVLRGYTERAGTQNNSVIVTGAMGTYLQLTGTASLLIGLQLFSPGRVLATTQANLVTDFSSNSSALTTKSAELLGHHLGQFTPPPPNPKEPQPKDGGAGGGR
jgi:hypothetical protein